MSLWTMSWGWKRYWHSSWRPCTKTVKQTGNRWISYRLKSTQYASSNTLSHEIQCHKNVYMRIVIWKCSWKGGSSHWESRMITSNGGKLSLHLHRFWWFALWYFSWPTAQQLPPQTLEKKIKHYCRFSTWWKIQIKDFELSAIFTDSKQVEDPAKTLSFFNSALHLHFFI